MSHVAQVEVQILDLDAMDAACRKLGLELRRGQQTYRWYGRSVGDYPLPAGFTEADLGKCSHAISVPGSTSAYEIGLVERRDGKPGLAMMFDFWAGGYGMENLAGKNASKLAQQYSIEAARRAAIKQGFRVTGEKTLANGSVQLVLAR